MPIIEGTYKLVTNENLTGILAAQGLGMIQRNLADKLNQTYKVKHDEAAKTITQTMIGKNENVAVYNIDGPAVEKEAAGGRGILLDSVKLSEKGYTLTRVEKTGKYTSIAEFVFEEGKMTIVMKTTTKDGTVAEGKRNFVKQ